jgi:hypothetical protein
VTVRAWFRLLRRSAWEADHPEILIYFRPATWRGEPLEHPARLCTLLDYQQVIDHGPPTGGTYGDLRRADAFDATWGWRGIK